MGLVELPKCLVALLKQYVILLPSLWAMERTLTFALGEMGMLEGFLHRTAIIRQISMDQVAAVWRAGFREYEGLSVFLLVNSTLSRDGGYQE